MSKQPVFERAIIPVNSSISKSLDLSQIYLETSDGRRFALDEVLNLLAEKLLILKAVTIGSEDKNKQRSEL